MNIFGNNYQILAQGLSNKNILASSPSNKTNQFLQLSRKQLSKEGYAVAHNMYVSLTQSGLSQFFIYAEEG